MGDDYLTLLRRAEATGRPDDWAPVLAIEEARMQERIPLAMRGPDGAARRADYLARHPGCASCEARGLTSRATAAVHVAGPDAGDGDDNLMPVCDHCLYVSTARRMGWPVRGCDSAGTPSDPDHPWNA